MAQSAISQHVAALMGSIPQQPAAPAVEEPRTWSFINRYTGERMHVTCMQGCTLDHTRESGRHLFPEDVWCWTTPEPLTLPVNTNGRPEEFAVLSTVIKVEPWSSKVAERLPYAVVELVDDHFVEGLDPDGLETVINSLQERLEQMRATHRRLVEVREEYMRRGRTVRSQADEALRRVRGEAV
ncbi:DUF6907 domain-containing protein [Streptomyces marokkonensis]|uniref:DUF6907 domain-containing protein n=1 Tax=Streptomyces marokkonensis TaxID=324855 RepID=UPI0011F296DA|nr:hypothetical protein [Streptomyces marokkonensis]